MFATLASGFSQRTVLAGQENNGQWGPTGLAFAADGALLIRSAAAIHILRRLGGVWRLLGGLARLCPSWILDRAYDGLARVRRRLFRRSTLRLQRRRCCYSTR